jgi:DNA-binding winged helix-turn-helix (wHTH) protein/Tol biopolymer transport system component
MSTGPEEKPTYEFGTFRLDPAERLLLRDGQAVSLTPKAFDLLVYLVERHGRLVEKNALMRALWPDTIVEEVNIAYNVSALRKVLGDGREDTKFIETVPTRGYRFVGRVTVSTTTPGDSSASPLHADPGRSRGHFSAYRIGLTAAAVAILAAVALFFARRDTTPTPAAARENKLTPLTANPADQPLESARISPDGKYLAYADATGIHLRRIDDGATHSIADTSGMDVLGWTSDSEKVRAAACTERSCTAWDVPITAGPRTPTGATWSDRHRADISARGSELLTVTETGEIAVTRLNGSSPRRIVGAGGIEALRAAALSIDGSRVFFTSNDGARIESVSAPGEAPSLLYTVPKGWSVISVGPMLADGRLFFVASQGRRPIASSSPQAIWHINTKEAAAKTDAAQVTEWSHEHIEQVSASTNGKRITFLSSEQQWDVYTATFDPVAARLDTPKKLTRDDRNDIVAAWMPDNATVLFTSSRSGNSDVFSQRFDSDIATPVAAGPGNQSLPRVTSDERWILFADAPSPDQRAGLSRQPLTGGVPERVIPEIPGMLHCSARGRCVITQRRGTEQVVSSLDPLQGLGTELLRHPAKSGSATLSGDGSEWAYIVPGESGTPDRILIVQFDNRRVSEIVVQITGTGRLSSLEWLPTGVGFFTCELTLGGSFSPLNGDLAQRSTLLFIPINGQARTVWAPENLLVGWATASRDGRRVAINAASRRSNAW